MSGRVASFACYCGAQDEVREPAPLNVDCWSCRKPLAMRRWTPRGEPPHSSARECTATEFKRAFEERGRSAGQQPGGK